jgi:hypothetical protein
MSTKNNIETVTSHRNWALAGVAGLVLSHAVQPVANWVQETLFDNRVVDADTVTEVDGTVTSNVIL